MNPNTGILKVLTTVKDLGETTAAKMAACWGEPDHSARVAICRYRKLGYLERVNPGQIPTVHRLTPKALELLGDDDYPRYQLPPVGIVQTAMRTQPVSVWHFAARC